MISSQVKALVFDVFGTVVDWRTSIIKHSRAFGEANGVTADWEAFADGWRGRYQPFMSKVRSGELPWTKLDTLHRIALEQLLTEFDIAGVSEEAKADLNLAWHRHDPSPDAPSGLTRLKAKFVIAAMTNGKIPSHHNDLFAAAGQGLKTAFVCRPLEFGPSGAPDLETDPSFDIRSQDLRDLASQLGV